MSGDRGDIRWFAFSRRRGERYPALAGNRHLPVEYEVLVAQLAATAELLEQLRAEPEAAKVGLSIERLEEAQRLMLSALARCESSFPDS